MLSFLKKGGCSCICTRGKGGTSACGVKHYINLQFEIYILLQFEVKVFSPGKKRKDSLPISPVTLLRDLQNEKKKKKVVSRTSIFFAEVVINSLH